MTIHIGTSGWSYPRGEGTWTGYFYPSDRKVDELEYYSSYFDTVEINSSFYRPPNPGIAVNWAKRVPQGFLFTVKLWQKFTHPNMYKETTGRNAAISQADADIFKRSLDPLARSGKLGALLAQYPPSFKNDDTGKNILCQLAGQFAGYRLAVELRHKSWSDDPSTAGLLSENNVTWVLIDEPKFKTSIAADIPATADFSYFRFHGRNAETWWTGNTETRYQYLYSPGEIDALSSKVQDVAAKSNLTFAFFNNHWKGYAPRNAIDMKRSLKQPAREFIDKETGEITDAGTLF